MQRVGGLMKGACELHCRIYYLWSLTHKILDPQRFGSAALILSTLYLTCLSTIFMELILN